MTRKELKINNGERETISLEIGEGHTKGVIKTYDGKLINWTLTVGFISEIEVMKRYKLPNGTKRTNPNHTKKTRTEHFNAALKRVSDFITKKGT